jgi:hypothetical protein
MNRIRIKNMMKILDVRSDLGTLLPSRCSIQVSLAARCSPRASLDRCGSPQASPDSCGYHIISDKVKSKRYIGIEKAGTSTLTCPHVIIISLSLI